MFRTKRLGVLTRAWWFSVGFNFSPLRFCLFFHISFFADALFCQLSLSFQLSTGLVCLCFVCCHFSLIVETTWRFVRIDLFWRWQQAFFVKP